MSNDPKKDTAVPHVLVEVGKSTYAVMKPEVLGIEGLPKEAVVFGLVGAPDRVQNKEYKQVIINHVSMDGKVNGLSDGKLSFSFERGHLKDGELTVDVDYLRNTISERLEEKKQFETRQQTADTEDNSRGTTMGETNLTTTRNGNAIKAALPEAQKKALGIPVEANAYLMGTATGDEAPLSQLVIETGGKSYPMGLGKTIMAKISGNQAALDEDKLDEMSKDAALAKKIASVPGTKPQDPAKAKNADGKEVDERGAEQGVDTSSAKDEGKGGFMDWLGNNKGGLAAGLMGLLIGAAMGGGLMGLIVGLLAFALMSKFMDNNGVVNNALSGEKKDDPNKGQGKSLKKDGAPGPENAIDVKEGENVQMVKTENGVKKYLSGQDKDGKLTYSDSPQEVTLRMQDKDGKITGLVKGRVAADGANFNIEETTSMLPDGRLSPNAGKTFTQLTVRGSDGSVEMGGESFTKARKPGADARDAYAKPTELTLKPGEGNRVSVEYGKTKVDDKEYTVVAGGTMSADGKKVTFDKALLKAGDEFVKGTDGKPIEVKLPNQEMDVLNGKISPQTGDVKQGVSTLTDVILKEQKKQVDNKEKADAGRAKTAVDAVTSAKGDKEAQEAVLNEQISKKLEELGIADPKQRAMMTADIKAKYMDASFREVSPEEARATVAGMVGTDDRVKAGMGDFAARIQEGVRDAMGNTATSDNTRNATAPAGAGLANTAPSPENVIDVKEGEKVQMVKTENGVKKYLSGQDQEGTLTYGEEPKKITLRLQDKDGDVTGLVKGKVGVYDAHFNIEEATSKLPDGRLSPKAGTTYNQLALDNNGIVEMKGPLFDAARKAGATASNEYAKPQDIKLEVADNDSVKANIGTMTINAGDKAVAAKVELQGSKDADNKTVTFEKALFKDKDNKYITDSDGKPIEAALPDNSLKNLQLLEGNKVAPMSGDVDSNKKYAVEGLRNTVVRMQADMAEAKSMSDSLSGNPDQTSAVISGKFNTRLKELGASEIEAAAMSAQITDKYKDPDFLKKSPQERIQEVTGTFKSGTLDKQEANAFARNMDGVISTSLAAELSNGSTAPAVVPAVADAAAAVEAGRAATGAGTSGPAAAPAAGTDVGVAQTGGTGPVQKQTIR